MKTCSGCGERKDFIEFSRNKRSKDGLQTQCKACNRLTYLKNAEEKKAKAREYYAANKDAAKERMKAYAKKNLESCSERKQKWAEENREAVRRQKREWAARNPEKVRALNVIKRGRRKNAAGSFTSEQWIARLEYHENCCYYCGASGKMEIEHRIPLSRGGTNWPSNLVPACGPCNRRKSSKTELEFRS
jgi:5-methylcytosine-specific restriction endonuclease McrA